MLLCFLLRREGENKMHAARANRTNLLRSFLVAVVVAVGVAVAVGVLSQQPSAQAQDASGMPSYTVTGLGSLGGGYSVAFDVNDAGQVVGEATLTEPENASATHAFLYDADATPKMTDLGTLGGDYSGANAINEAGQVVGDSTTTAGSYRTHAFLYDESATPKMRDLGSLGRNQSFANDINEAGQVVGHLGPFDNHPQAFLYSGGQMVDLNSLIPSDSSWTLSSAFAINNKGQIVGYEEKDHSSRRHAFLLTPRNEGCTISGTNSSDVLEGTGGKDVICAKGGHDVVDSRAGGDILRGGPGIDAMQGGLGADALYGGDGADVLDASDGVRANDTVNGGPGRDICLADRGDKKVSCP
jgi:probable HAF family extracellular repeat protein